MIATADTPRSPSSWGLKPLRCWDPAGTWGGEDDVVGADGGYDGNTVVELT
ncbi:hypothetical protein [Corynebacterium matruchotii]|uniref:hypothetical protein n=1 Tax=Corynebacterium matruchotii TaxID=43768 RepID=UPI002889A740|nr:hypothetical protein [Corynebacterium matruchotii]